MGIGKMYSFPGRNGAGENRAIRKVKDALERGLQTEGRSGALFPGHCEEEEGALWSQGRTCTGSESNGTGQ